MVFKYSKFLKTGSAVVLMTGGGWMCYQVYQTKFILSHILKTEVLEVEKKRAQYIYINDPTFKEEANLFKDEKVIKRGVFERMSIVQWWKSWKHSVAWRLLSMAQAGDRSDRIKAVQWLTDLKDLKDSDYRQLAQACDARTAIGLARTKGVDLRFFLPAPYSHMSTSLYETIESLRKLFNEMVGEKPHPCVEYFLSKAFPEFQHRYKVLDHDVASIEASNSVIRHEDLLLVCLRNLLHHSAIGDNAKDIALKGGLSLLMTVYKKFDSNSEIPLILASLLANISVHPDLLEPIHRSGWIGVLARWAQDGNICLSAPAAKALANLDRDAVQRICYPRRIYLLHPTWRRTYKPKMDVVFVHGLLGGVFVTWRQRDREYPETTVNPPLYIKLLPQQISDEQTQEYLAEWQEEWEEVGRDFELVLDDVPEQSSNHSSGPFCVGRDDCSASVSPYILQGSAYRPASSTQCWPKDWLPEDCRYLRVLGVNYDTSLSLWGPMCPADTSRGTLSQRSMELIEKLQKAGVGERPVVWVTHSMGGLLVKNMLVKAWESGDPKLKKFCKNSKAIVFYSVPHSGSPLAALAPTAQFFLWPTVEVQELRENSPTLLDLHRRFEKVVQELSMKVVSFAETKPTTVPALRMQFLFVPPSSADPGIGEYFVIPQDHLCICKPANRESFLYQKLLQVIRNLMENP